MITIQEILTDLKYRSKRAEKKGQSVLSNLYRTANTVDKMLADGGTEKFCDREMQGMNDMLMLIVAQRAAIQKSNLTTVLTVEGDTMSVAEWIIWKREVYPVQQAFLNSMLANLRRVSSTPRKVDEPDIIYHVSEQKVIKTLERLQNQFEKLDGLLSLNNATVTVEL